MLYKMYSFHFPTLAPTFSFSTAFFTGHTARKKRSSSTFVDPSKLLFFVTITPSAENSRSYCDEVARIASTRRASAVTSGMLSQFSAHHGRGSTKAVAPFSLSR